MQLKNADTLVMFCISTVQMKRIIYIISLNQPKVYSLDQRVVSERYTSPIQNSPRSKQMETGGEIFVGHLQAFCPWIMMMMMTVYNSFVIIKLQAIFHRATEFTVFY